MVNTSIGLIKCYGTQRKGDSIWKRLKKLQEGGDIELRSLTSITESVGEEKLSSTILFSVAGVYELN